MLKKTKVTEQDASLRVTNFDEVTCGYQYEEAIEEAKRCLFCKHEPCRRACPVDVPIKDFIALLKDGNVDQAYQKIMEENTFPAICGRVCPQEKQCEEVCIRALKGEAVAIGLLERFVGDHGVQKKVIPKAINHKKVAIVGSGPAGLACAIDLGIAGFDVTIFEALHELGGVLAYGIPDFRLPKDVLKKELKTLESLNVKVERNVVVGKSVTLVDLFEEGFEVIFIGTGAGLPKALGLENENMVGVHYANGFLTRVNLMKSRLFPVADTPVHVGTKVAVVGAGNVAMDAARTAKRLGAKEVTIVYRRSRLEVPARLEEVHHAEEEGINFRFLTNPVAIMGHMGIVTGMRCEKMALGEPGEDGRRRPIGTKEMIDLDVDSVIIAVGQNPNPTVFEGGEGLKRTRWGTVEVNPETLETSMRNVYAGGDIVTGAATVILALGAGRQAAKSIIQRLLP